MCRVQSQRQPELSQSSVDKTARKVVRKYRRMTLRREMRRLRRIVLEEGERRVSSGQLLERTVSLIEDLETRLECVSPGGKPAADVSFYQLYFWTSLTAQHYCWP